MKRNWLFPFVFLLVLLYSCNEDQTTKPEQSTTENVSEIPTSSEYQEIHRPLFHFTPPSGWMGEPNGLVYHDGEYHMFYQYNPDNIASGPMHWGHAVSKDLVHWKHLLIAIEPDKLGYIYSGSVVMDYENTSGLGVDGQAAMIAIYTYHDSAAEKKGSSDFQTQGMAYSIDNGRTWTKFKDKPILSNPGLKHFRDPKVIWYPPNKKWIMLLAAENKVMMYHSSNLKDWTFASEFGKDQGNHDGAGLWKCPDLFYLPHEGAAEGGKWILLVSIDKGKAAGGSATQYFIGDFDGTEFTNDYPKETVLWLDFGKDYTSAVSWSGAPIGDTRRIILGWMSNSSYSEFLPTEKWRGAMALPRTLRLIKDPRGSRLDIQVSKEIRSLNYSAKTLPPFDLLNEIDITADLGFAPKASVILLDFTPSDGKRPLVGLEFSNSLGEKVIIDYDFLKGTYSINRRASGKINFADDFAAKNSVSTGNGHAKNTRIFIFTDVSSIEVFTEKNNLVMTNLVFPTQPYDKVKIFSKNGTCKTQVRMMGVKGVW